MSIYIITCGRRGILKGLLRSVRTRSCSRRGVRIILVSDVSASSAGRVVREFRRRVASFGGIRILGGPKGGRTSK